MQWLLSDAPSALSLHGRRTVCVNSGWRSPEYQDRLRDAYGLCQIYENEPWHDELRAASIDRGCPQMCADPTQDPRMQQ